MKPSPNRMDDIASPTSPDSVQQTIGGWTTSRLSRSPKMVPSMPWYWHPDTTTERDGETDELFIGIFRSKRAIPVEDLVDVQP